MYSYIHVGNRKLPFAHDSPLPLGAPTLTGAYNMVCLAPLRSAQILLHSAIAPFRKTSDIPEPLYDMPLNSKLDRRTRCRRYLDG